jgi:hypothetical protein
MSQHDINSNLTPNNPQTKKQTTVKRAAALPCPADSVPRGERVAPVAECARRHAQLGRVARDPTAVQDARRFLRVELRILRAALASVPTLPDEGQAEAQ